MSTSNYYVITTLDNGKVLGFPLKQANGDTNDYTGATAELRLHDSNANNYVFPLTFNSVSNEWEYSVVAGDFPAGRVWGRVAVTFPNFVGPIESTEFMFDVVDPS